MTFLRRKCRSGLAGRSAFGFAGGTPAATSAFTIMELLIVITIIIVLAGLVMTTTGYVQRKGARSRAETEVAAISSALENYKADNERYPTTPATDALKPNQHGDPRSSLYILAGKDLYIQLTGDTDGNPATPERGAKNYMGSGLKSNMLNPQTPGPNTYITDPFGNCYGYSTVKGSAPAGADGYNPTFDLWSTAGTTGGSAGERGQWIKNW